jgi:fatty acid desaturase
MPGSSTKLRERSNIIYVETFFYYAIILALLVLIKHSYLSLSLLQFVLIGIVAIPIIGWAQFSISNGFHEALHYNFGKKHSDLVSSILTAYPIFLTMDYRAIHLAHHKYFGDPVKDPDYENYRPFPKSKGDFLKRMFYHLSGISAVKQFFSMNGINEEQKVDNKDVDKYGKKGLILTQLVIITLFYFAFKGEYIIEGFIAFGLFWMIPVVTVGKCLSSSRLLCEHGNASDQLTYRTITGNLLSTSTLGAYKFNFHAEHHIKAFIPYTNLEASKEIIGGKIVRDDIIYDEYHGGYVSLLWKWFKKLP